MTFLRMPVYWPEILLSLVLLTRKTSSDRPFKRSQTTLILILLAAGDSSQFRGGKKRRRDTWFGLETKENFTDFKRWWHRKGKFAAGGMDLKSCKDAENAYNDWVSQGSAKVK